MARASDDRSSALELVRRLIEASQADTVYRDLYLRRARAAFATGLPASEYARLKGLQLQIDRATQQGRVAVVCGDWQCVRDLAGMLSRSKRSFDAKREEFTLAAELYEPERFPLDPFSLGFEGFVGGMRKVAGVLARLRQTLEDLQRLDINDRDRYGARRVYFEKLAMTPEEWNADIKTINPEVAAAQALHALEQGEAERLCRLAERMLSAPRPHNPNTAPEKVRRGFDHELAEPLPSEVVARARELGLAYVELSAVPDVAEYLREKAWHPTFSDSEQTEDGATRVQRPSDPETPQLPEEIRELIALFALHPYVNSGGARYLPRLRAQPVLFEDFPEDVEPPLSPLLAALGLGRRRSLSRLAIETALLERGSDVLTERLGLDPWRFRLLCIPFDVYARVGGDRGWGRREQWTHFDGYQLMRNGGLRALVGGDARYGGVYDLVSIGRDDQREQVIARFAVVRRERLLNSAT